METAASAPLKRRKAIFADLVQVQDDSIPVRISRVLVARRFGIAIEEVETIEREGLMRKWPPLD
jgi:hypothetical protein